MHRTSDCMIMLFGGPQFSLDACLRSVLTARATAHDHVRRLSPYVLLLCFPRPRRTKTSLLRACRGPTAMPSLGRRRYPNERDGTRARGFSRDCRNGNTYRG